jgi:hypothetical protein
MGEPPMPTNEDLYDKVQEWAKRQPQQLRCRACDSHHWELRSLDETFGGHSADEPADIPPVITIMCTCCGHLSFYNSKAMGL